MNQDRVVAEGWRALILLAIVVAVCVAAALWIGNVLVYEPSRPVDPGVDYVEATVEVEDR